MHKTHDDYIAEARYCIRVIRDGTPEVGYDRGVRERYLRTAAASFRLEDGEGKFRLAADLFAAGNDCRAFYVLHNSLPGGRDEAEREGRL